MNLYLAGPMRGYPGFNFPSFFSATEFLRGLGHTVCNPAEHDIEVLGEAAWKNDDGSLVSGESASENFVSFMRYDLDWIVNQAEGIVLLPGWEKSHGATHEKLVADLLELQVFYAVPIDIEARRWVVWDTPPRKPLVGIFGAPGAGKDTVADALVQKLGFTKVSFADPMREIAKAINPIIGTQIVGHEGEVDFEVVHYVEALNAIGYTEMKAKYPGARRFLQRLGTDAGRNILGETFWIDLAMKRVDAAKAPVVIPDVRFQNEYDAVKAKGGFLIQIDRPDAEALDASTASHASEIEWRSFEPDGFFVNDGPVDGIGEAVANYVEKLLLPQS